MEKLISVYLPRCFFILLSSTKFKVFKGAFTFSGVKKEVYMQCSKDSLPIQYFKTEFTCSAV